MNKLIILPIEPLDMRYSTQWAYWFYDYLCGCPELTFQFINPEPLTTEITNGAFLDICGTNYYKAKQLMELCELVHLGHIDENTTILVHDAWFPGVEMLAYMRDGLGINFKIAGCFHAGTYDQTDFISKLGMGKWGCELEESWFTIYDSMFVATEYHKWLMCVNRNVNKKKIHVTGFPLFRPEVDFGLEKQNIVVFPHRLTDDKQPELFDMLAADLKAKYPHWDFVKTQEHPRTKHEYYQLLRNSKIAVSFALHENWGIGMQEAVMVGCLPVVPNRLAYKEMYGRGFRYDTTQEAIDLVEGMINACDKDDLTNYFLPWHTMKDRFIDNGSKAIHNIMEVLRG